MNQKKEEIELTENEEKELDKEGKKKIKRIIRESKISLFNLLIKLTMYLFINEFIKEIGPSNIVKKLLKVLKIYIFEIYKFIKNNLGMENLIFFLKDIIIDFINLLKVLDKVSINIIYGIIGSILFVYIYEYYSIIRSFSEREMIKQNVVIILYLLLGKECREINELFIKTELYKKYDKKIKEKLKEKNRDFVLNERLNELLNEILEYNGMEDSYIIRKIMYDLKNEIKKIKKVNKISLKNLQNLYDIFLDIAELDENPLKSILWSI